MGSLPRDISNIYASFDPQLHHIEYFKDEEGQERLRLIEKPALGWFGRTVQIVWRFLYLQADSTDSRISEVFERVVNHVKSPKVLGFVKNLTDKMGNNPSFQKVAQLAATRLAPTPPATPTSPSPTLSPPKTPPAPAKVLSALEQNIKDTEDQLRTLSAGDSKRPVLIQKLRTLTHSRWKELIELHSKEPAKLAGVLKDLARAITSKPKAWSATQGNENQRLRTLFDSGKKLLEGDFPDVEAASKSIAGSLRDYNKQPRQRLVGARATPPPPPPPLKQPSSFKHLPPTPPAILTPGDTAINSEATAAGIVRQNPTAVPNPLPRQGINNIGNTCYLNTAFKNLIATPGLAGLLTQELPEGPRRLLQTVVRELATKSARAPLDAKDARKLVDAMKATGWNKKFGSQHDSSEAYTHLINALGADKLPGLRYVIEESRCNLPGDPSPFEQTGPTLRGHSLSLVPSGTPLQDLVTSYFDSFVETEFTLTSGRVVNAFITTRRFTGNMPTVLPISINRTAGGNVKNTSRVMVDPYLKMPNTDTWYECTSMAFHSGRTANGGHYFALNKDLATGVWILENDSQVTGFTSLEDAYNAIHKMYGQHVSTMVSSVTYTKSP